MTGPRQRFLPMLLVLPLFVACESAGSREAPAPASSRASGPSTPAPLPSSVTDDYEAARRASRTAAPTGPNAMPGFAPVERVSTDIQLAPIPQPLPR